MHKMLIGDQWLSARDGRTLPVVNPSDGQPFDEISRGSAHEIDLAVRPPVPHNKDFGRA